MPRDVLPSSTNDSVDSFTRLILCKESVDCDRNFQVCIKLSSFPTLKKYRRQNIVYNQACSSKWQCFFSTKSHLRFYGLGNCFSLLSILHCRFPSSLLLEQTMKKCSTKGYLGVCTTCSEQDSRKWTEISFTTNSQGMPIVQNVPIYAIALSVELLSVQIG